VASKITANMAGCWFDSASGIYTGEAVIDEAIARGFDPQTECPEAGWADYEYYHELWTEAEEFLGSLAPDGYCIGSNENGDFGMWAVCKSCGEYTEEPQDDCEFCRAG